MTLKLMKCHTPSAAPVIRSDFCFFAKSHCTAHVTIGDIVSCHFFNNTNEKWCEC